MKASDYEAMLAEKHEEQMREAMNDTLTREGLIQQIAGLLSTIEFTPSTRHPSQMFGVAAQILGMVEERATTNDLTELAWGLIANAYGGNWNMASKEWERAAERWRDRYHDTLPAVDAALEEEQ